MNPLLRTVRSFLALAAIALGAACDSGNRIGNSPTLTAVQPTTGSVAGGTTITLTGVNFLGTVTVTVGGAAATAVTVVNTGTITATTPAGTVGAADVQVTTSTGTTTLPGAFSFQHVAPTLTGVAPQSGLEIGGTPITLTGANFAAGATVTIGGAPATNVAVLSPNVLTAETPTGTVGAATIAVTTAGGTVTLANSFTFLDASPELQGVSPTSGSETGGTLITLTGANFLGTVTVTVGGVAATSVTVVDTETITAVTPVGTAGAHNVAVTTAQGTSQQVSVFTFTAASLFVTNNAAGSWSVHGLADNGDTPPARVVTGVNTAVVTPIGICVAGGKTYVASINGDAIVVHDEAATGNAAPLQAIVGAATLIDGPTGVCVDLTRSEIYAASVFANRVTVHDLASNGNVAPLRVLEGNNTGISQPEGVWTVDGELYVANATGGSNGFGSVTVYGLTDAGNVGPRRTIGGPNTGLAAPQGLCVAHGNVFVANRDGNSVTVHVASANGDVVPARSIVGTNAGFDQPQAVFVTATEIFVVNAGNDTVTVHALAASGDVAPLRTIAGASTGFATLEGVFVR
jgi:hypothetical protein